MQKTLDLFFAEIGPRAFRFAELGLRNRDDALDAVQDAMLKMMQYRDVPATEWTPIFWKILRNRIVDFQRRAGLRLRWLTQPKSNNHEDSDWEPDWQGVDHDDPAGMLQARQTYAALATALAALPARQREAFYLRIVEQLDVAQTAAVMGCSEGSVKTHLSRARHAIDTTIQPDDLSPNSRSL
ncbi:RNA polymerase sigma factor [Luteimonas sp. FXH3W]|uniref:RNA polymerase sigma factor n=1 Tax=Aquilutibacter rugosus TaxID=3115820 RepID=A0ABU7UWV8_9GAMM